jgi:NAD-dependent oxidoreductase involved in siderophore biosynthesis
MNVEELAGQLEPVVDRHGIAAVLEALAFLCEAKSEHITSAWQDRALARSWKKVGARRRAGRQGCRERAAVAHEKGVGSCG